MRRGTGQDDRSPTISVVICCYNDERWPLLVEAIGSALRQEPTKPEVVVVVDYNPSLLSRVQETFPDVVAVTNTEQKGLSGARNTGIAVAKGSLIVFLDDDAVAAPNFVALLAEPMTDPAVLAVGGNSVPAWEAAPPRWFPAEFYWTIGCTHRGVPTHRNKVRNVLGGCMAIRRDIFDVVGGFRSDLGRIDAIPLGCEETELCIRAQQARPDMIFLHEPAAVIHHFVPRKRATWAYFSSRCLAEGYSKALVSRFVGTSDGLRTERSYVMRILTTGVLVGLRDAVKGDLGGLGRAGAIVAGLAITTLGFVRGRLSRAVRERVETSTGAPPIKAKAPATSDVPA
jgi:glycosyltransferase involved in cell wall biosynthesis